MSSSADLNPKLAFVLPRFGREIAGGAETLVGGLARELAKRGYEIDVLTTCAKDNRTWENHFSAGVKEIDGITVRRFPVSDRDLEKWVPLQIRIADGFALTVAEQLDWMENSVLARDLLSFLNTSAANYRWVIYAPYLFGTTFWGSLTHPENAILLPCLHDESYAWLDVTRVMFQSAQGCIFNAEPERQLAEGLFGPQLGAEVGMGFDEYESFEFSERAPYFSEQKPYILSLGRKETGKNLHLLVQYFQSYKEQFPSDLRLVIAGGGDYRDLGLGETPGREDIIDLGQVSESDKLRLLQHAELFVQPSVNESFSIVIMESWLTKTPVVVHAGCDVTRHHCVESNAGLFFADFAEFCAVVNHLRENEQLRVELGERGRAYVRAKYNWEAVIKRFSACLRLFESAQEQVPTEACCDS